MSQRQPNIPLEKDRPSISYLKGMLKDARFATLQCVKSVSFEELHWQPYSDWNSISCLLIHSYAVSELLRIQFIENRTLTEKEKKDLAPARELGDVLLRSVKNFPLDYFLEKLQVAADRLLMAVEKLNSDTLYQLRDGYGTKNGCNLAWVLYHIAEDEIHHKGQIAMLRKWYLQASSKAIDS